MAYPSESPSWHRRRKLRQRITLAVIVLLVLGVGGTAYAYFEGLIGLPGDDVATVTAPLPCPTPTSRARGPLRVRVNVYNATTRAGLAAGAAKALMARSFVVSSVGNDPAHAIVTGPAVVRYGPKGATGAKLVAAQVRGAKLVRGKRKSTVVDLVLGADYVGLRAMPTSAPTSSAIPCVTASRGPLPRVRNRGKSIPTTPPR